MRQAGGGGGRRWRVTVISRSPPIASPPADGTGRGRQRSEDRGGGQEGGWEKRIARTVKGPLEIGRDALYLRPVMAAARLLGRLCAARAWGTAWAGGWRSPGSAVRCEREGVEGVDDRGKKRRSRLFMEFRLSKARGEGVKGTASEPRSPSFRVRRTAPSVCSSGRRLVGTRRESGADIWLLF